jgi:hypothetical protein
MIAAGETAFLCVGLGGGGAASSPFAFPPTEDDYGTVAKLAYRGESEQTAGEHIAEAYQSEHDAGGKDDALGWLAAYLGTGCSGAVGAGGC